MGKKGKKSNSSSTSTPKVTQIQEPDFGSPKKPNQKVVEPEESDLASKKPSELTIGDKKLLRARENEKREEELEKKRIEESKRKKLTKIETSKTKVRHDSEKSSRKKSIGDEDFESYTKLNQMEIKKEEFTSKLDEPQIDYWDGSKPNLKNDSRTLDDDNRKRNQGSERQDFRKYSDKSPSRNNRDSFSKQGPSTPNWRSRDDKDRDKNRPKPKQKNRSRIIQNEKYQINYEVFESKLNKTNLDFGKVEELTGDLFNAPKDFSLAHCVAEDFSMGAGIAIQFRKEFKNVPELLQQKIQTGGVAVLKNNDRFIYYLVTKKYSGSKPTLKSLWNSLIRMKEHMIENEVNKLAVPQLGCGLDRLDWGDVKQMIEFIFQDMEVEILVFSLDFGQTPPQTSRELKGFKRHASYPLVDIVSGTGLIFFGTEDSYISEELKSLDSKYSGLIQFYQRERKVAGEIVRYTRHSDYVFGLIWKKTQRDEIDYKILGKCLYALKKINKGNDKYEYFGFDAFIDDYEGNLTIEKIINVFQSVLTDCETYICWPEKIRQYMPNHY